MSNARKSGTEFNVRRRSKPFWHRPVVVFMEALIVAGLLGGGGYGFYVYAQDSDRFYVRQFMIDGLVEVDENDVVEASGVTLESSLLFLDCEGLADRISALPGIERCTVTRLFPDTVQVTVHERTPVATLIAQNHCYVIDQDCVVLRALQPNDSPVGPLISSIPDLVTLEAGQRVEAEVAHEAVRVYLAYSATKMSQKTTVSEIAAYHVNDIRMYCDELPFEIRWGRGDYEPQARRLDILWETKGPYLNCWEYLDLRYGRDIACR